MCFGHLLDTRPGRGVFSVPQCPPQNKHFKWAFVFRPLMRMCFGFWKCDLQLLSEMAFPPRKPQGSPCPPAPSHHHPRFEGSRTFLEVQLQGMSPRRAAPPPRRPEGLHLGDRLWPRAPGPRRRAKFGHMSLCYGEGTGGTLRRGRSEGLARGSAQEPRSCQHIPRPPQRSGRCPPQGPESYLLSPHPVRAWGQRPGSVGVLWATLRPRPPPRCGSSSSWLPPTIG